jgi:hypothetical protein
MPESDNKRLAQEFISHLHASKRGKDDFQRTLMDWLSRPAQLKSRLAWGLIDLARDPTETLFTRTFAIQTLLMVARPFGLCQNPEIQENLAAIAELPTLRNRRSTSSISSAKVFGLQEAAVRTLLVLNPDFGKAILERVIYLYPESQLAFALEKLRKSL